MDLGDSARPPTTAPSSLLPACSGTSGQFFILTVSSPCPPHPASPYIIPCTMETPKNGHVYEKVGQVL